MPAEIRLVAENRPASRAVSIDPPMKPSAPGTVASPAASGESPSTSCRYCAMNSYTPEDREEARPGWCVERGAERGRAEQAEVDQRVGEPALAAHEYGAERDAGDSIQRRGSAPSRRSASVLSP